MAEEKKQNPTTEGYFVGKELFKEGSKNGKAWKMYKLKFKPRMDSEKGFTMTVFNDAKAKGSKLLNELEEGKQYKIIYDEKEAINNDGIPFTSKTAFGFYSVRTESKATAKETTEEVVITERPSFKGIDLSKFDTFKVRYLEALKKNNMQPNFVHMTGSFLISAEKERTEGLAEKCKEALK